MKKEAENKAAQMQEQSDELSAAAADVGSQSAIDKLLERIEKLEKVQSEEESEIEAARKDFEERKELSKRLMEERVPIRLRYDNSKGDSVFVCVNGKAIQIKRGEEVEIPKAFEEVLRHAEEQSENALRFIERTGSVN